MRVFCIFGNPLVIVSDNGPAFRNDLAAAMAQFIGYRHIFIMPYNAQANGAAEACVKRLKLLMDRLCAEYLGWHKQLPLMQQLLNSTSHTSTEACPHTGVFGVAPIGWEQLEDPRLMPDAEGAPELVRSLRQRLVHLRAEMQRLSDSLKEVRNGRAMDEPAPDAKVAVGDWVWVYKGSAQQAAFQRKHGHGEVWRFRYRVADIKPHAVRLHIPTDGSAPRIREWQSPRKLAPVNTPVADHTPVHQPITTEQGVLAKAPPAPVPEPDREFEVDRVLVADRDEKGRLQVWLLWKGYPEATARLWSQLRREVTGALYTEANAAIKSLKKSEDELHATAEPDSTPPANQGYVCSSDLLGIGSPMLIGFGCRVG